MMNGNNRVIPSGDSVSLDGDGYTELANAAFLGNMRKVRLLCRSETVNYLCSTFPFTAVYAAGVAGDSDVVDYLITEGAKVCIETEVGNSPLYLGVVGGHADAVISILNLTQFLPAMSLKNKDGHTLAHAAAIVGETGVLKKIFETDIGRSTINEISGCGGTPLHVALEHMKRRDDGKGYVAYMRKFTADKTVISGSAYVSEVIDMQALVKLFIENGADLSIKNNKGKRPIDLTQDTKIIEILQKAMEKAEDIPHGKRAKVSVAQGITRQMLSASATQDASIGRSN